MKDKLFDNMVCDTRHKNLDLLSNIEKKQNADRYAFNRSKNWLLALNPKCLNNVDAASEMAVILNATQRWLIPCYLMVELSAPCLTASRMKVVAAVWLCFTRIWSICFSSGWSNIQATRSTCKTVSSSLSEHNARLTDGVRIHNCALHIDAQSGNRWIFACEWSPSAVGKGILCLFACPRFHLLAVFAANWGGLLCKLNTSVAGGKLWYVRSVANLRLWLHTHQKDQWALLLATYLTTLETVEHSEWQRALEVLIVWLLLNAEQAAKLTSP